MRVPSRVLRRFAVLLGVVAGYPACGDSSLSPEVGESLSGGAATTVLLLGSNSFSLPAPNLSSERRAPF
ncbi:MAG: thiol oxidoreductase, partial [Myxococcota bacterium]